jgi:hypothetical protein
MRVSRRGRRGSPESGGDVGVCSVGRLGLMGRLGLVGLLGSKAVEIDAALLLSAGSGDPRRARVVLHSALGREPLAGCLPL